MLVLTALTMGSCAGVRHAAVVPSANASVDLVIASTTDVHGRIRSWDYFTNKTEPSRGLSRAATIVDSLRASAPNGMILLDAGDLLQGNPFSYMVAHAPELKANTIVAAMNSMQYDASAIGNHEFNYGVPNLDSAIAQARFPFLSANIYRLDGSHAYEPWTLITRQGVRVAIIGATTPGVVLWDAENVRGRLTFGDIVPAVRKAVGEAKAAGANVVIVDIHSGLDEPSSYDTVATNVPSENVAARVAAEVPGIDLLLYGHSHREMKEKIIGSTLLVQPRNWATSVSVAHLHLDRGAAGWSVTRKSAELIQAAGHEEAPRIIALSEQTHQLTLAHFNSVIGTTPSAWLGDSSRVKDTPLLDFVLETERRVSGADLASSAAFATDAVLGPGAVTGAQIAHLYPYDNTLRVIRISGKQLREYLDFSSRYYTGRRTASGTLETDPLIASYNFDIVAGADYTIDLTKPIGSRITRLVFKGQAVRDGDTFTFALSNYRQGGGGGFSMVAGSPVLKEIQTIVPEFLIEEVKRRGVLKQEDFFTPNWNIIVPPIQPSVH
ncbi:MAG: 5'-nucleotidase C-terminal domain-containing protein [Gemmatimonadota bacterium]|nr:5'-nucleotidase C-terminal domain-containing protein [Gemmatimonadota bacterium]